MPEDQAVVEAPSSSSDDGGPLDALDDAQGAGSPSSDDSAEAQDAGAAGGESQQVEEGQAEGAPKDGESEVSPKTEAEVLRERVEALEAANKAAQEERDRAVKGHNELMSRYDKREQELAPLLEQQVRDLDGLIGNDEYWENRIAEVGMTPAMVERDAAIEKRAIIHERGRAERERLATRDREQLDSMRRKFLDAGKTESDFQKFVNERNGLASYTYKDAHALVDSVLAGEHAHKVSAEAQEKQAREIEANLRRKNANQTAKSGAPAAAKGAAEGTPESALEGMAAAKARIDAVDALF